MNGEPLVLRARAPAKLNLFLRVVGRRPDGFHELETVFQAIDLADELTFAPAADLQLTGGSAAAPPGPKNLVLRAAAALRAAAGHAGGAAIHLEKRIPVGAGLGGGSSDAAATLAAGLGSDVPFALQGGTALGRGRGELLEPIIRDETGAAAARLTVVLARPPFPVPTPRAFALYRPAPPDAPALPAFLAALATGDPARLAPQLRNDLESGVFGEWPVLATVRERLLAAGALGARMTGSGSVLFGLARDEPHAHIIADRLAAPDLWVQVARAWPWAAVIEE